MTRNDPRHGTWAGYVAGCRRDCCREAARLYQKRRVHEARPRRVPSIGLRRRIQALACLGWDMYAIAREVGTGRETVRQWTIHDTVYRTTHERMAEVYERLSMRLPPETTHQERANAARARNRAARNRWAPPLAWDDIDDPDETPAGAYDPHRHRDEVDEAVVCRVMAGERLHTTPAEKAEVLRRWRAAGLPVAELERMTGWKRERYSGRAA